MGVPSRNLIAAAGATGVFLALFALVYVAHARWFAVDVVFYSALLDALIAATLCALGLFLVPALRRLSGLEKLQLCTIWLLLGYAIAISVPTVIDRSLSFYILEKLAQRGGSLRQDAMAEIFVNEYMHEHRLVDVRLTEQLASGTIEIADGCVSLTDKGRLIAQLSRSFRLNLLPRQRLLMGEYTDDLTDPFRQSRGEADHRCAPAVAPGS